MRRRASRFIAILPWCLLCLALSSVLAWAGEAGPKKLIYYGWGVPDTQYVRDHWQEMEQMPFDGTGISVKVDRQAGQQGKTQAGGPLGMQVMGKRAFRLEEFRDAIADLKVARWQRFTDNFLPIALSSDRSAADLHWFDDARWQVIANNFGVAAQIAAAGGMKGLILDPEHYKYQLFSYARQRQHVDKPFEAHVQMARQRGRQLMEAIAAHLPDAVLLALFGYSLPFYDLHVRGSKSLPEAPYGLLSAFYDGLLEAMPAGGKLVDGCEHAYPYTERQQFLTWYRRIHGEAIRLSAVPDRYRQHVKVGFGLWLDYKQKLEHFTPAKFRQAVRVALEVSDGYVWIYSQGPRFFSAANVDQSYIEALAEARRGVRR